MSKGLKTAITHYAVIITLVSGFAYAAMWVGNVNATVTQVDSMQNKVNAINDNLKYFMGKMGVRPIKE